jgi:hypothetical protein
MHGEHRLKQACARCGRLKKAQLISINLSQSQLNRG